MRISWQYRKKHRFRELEDALVQGGQVDENGLADFEWEASMEVRLSLVTVIKMEFSFGDEYKDGPILWGTAQERQYV